MSEHHHGGLAADVDKLLGAAASRRQTLRWLLAGAASVPLAGCGGGGDSGASTAGSTVSSGSSSGATTGGTNASCALIPEETGGPYPADGTNSSNGKVANALVLSGIVRSDIRASIAGASGVAQGVPLTIRLKIVNVAGSCATVTGATVYLWHCDRNGNYSMYSSSISAENYLRGVQAADADGYVTFLTIFPGCYDGRMPHVHFEVYPNLATSTTASNRIKTSQFTFPLATLNTVYTATGYATSVQNLARISYASDNVFSDGTALQMAAMSGDVVNGYVAELTVGVSL
ncbi:dioxygenase family protein [Massilia brevitalea]|uniref:dioxygenase family protein n=1 Tax=Massilia brevitalea TaxID=442526 RepID=UPI00273953F0|nr:intradiol ring-cleavage dioxygenase [Massilia brevitalea]